MDIHVYSSEYGVPDSQAHREAIEDFLDKGVIVECRSGFKTTDLGLAWINAICNTKIPRQVFLDDQGNEL